MTDLERLQETFKALGVFYYYQPVDGTEARERQKLLAEGMPLHATEIVKTELETAAAAFYFNADGRYLGLIAGDEQPSWEGRNVQ